MSPDVVLVDLAALATVAWIAWYFWLSEGEAVAAATGAGGVQEIHVRVKGGYDPDLVVVEAGRPVRLLFNRQETAACSERVLFPDFDVSRELPYGETVAIEIEAPPAGEYEFACQMGMLRGKLIAKNGSGAAFTRARFPHPVDFDRSPPTVGGSDERFSPGKRDTDVR